MPYEVKWLVEGRVIYQRLYGTITLEEYQEVQKLGQVLFDQRKPPVIHTLVDVMKLEKSPSIGEIMRLPHPKNPEGMGWMVLSIENALFRFIGSVVAQFVVKNFKLTRNLEEACAFLNHMDSTLPPLNMSETTPPSDPQG
jgi:hypothetical protein